ncbi:MAG: RNA helicase, partial [Candidatus Methanomethylicota archaeon]
MKIVELPISDEAKELLQREGFRELYPPQELAVKSGLLEGENSVVASPTASGKTLIAMLAAIKHFSEKVGKTIYLTPLRALASEKYREFKLMEKLGAKVRISTGDYDTPGYELRDADVIVTTNEKMDSLLRHNSPWIKESSLIVADEIHLIGFEDRGPTLEVLITRLLHEIPNAQILALSATVSNAYEIAEWLDAKVIDIDWRPVPLKEGVFFQHKIYFANGEVSRVKRLTGSPRIDLVLDEIMNGGQAIAFMRTRTDAVKAAIRIAEAIKENPLIRRSLNETELKKLSDRVLVEGERTQLSDILSSLIKFGVAFHHAGLSSIHRSLIEDAFREGKLKALTATPTLAAGVNLPSRRVIITYLSRYSMGFSQPLSVFEYKQMAGRAGRPRYDEYG